MASNPNAFDDFFDDEEPEDVVDTKPDGRLLRVPLSRISPNLVNPRTDFGTKDQLEDFGRSLKRRQLQAAPVVTRKAYLKLWPEHEDRIGNVDVVIVSGERRFRAATAVALPALECVINDDVAESRRSFLDAVVSENIDRQNFDAIEEASAVDVLVQAFGTARAVAEHYERGDAWVSQRRVLLRLAPGVQQLVRRRAMPLEPARKLGKLVKDHGWSEAEQLAWWEREQQGRAQVAAEKKAARKVPEVPATVPVQPADSPVAAHGEAPAAPGASFTAVKTGASPDPVPVPSTALGMASPPAIRASQTLETPPPALPEPRPVAVPAPPPQVLTGEAPTVRRLPALGWAVLAEALVDELPREDRHRLTVRLWQVMTAEKGPHPSA